MKYYIIACAAMAALTGPPAFAGTIVQSEGVTLLDVGTSFAAPLPFNRFDPALGTLDSVTLDLTASFSGTVGVENTSASPDMVTGIIAGSVTVATSSSSLTVEVFPSAPGPAHHLTAFDGSLDFAGTSGATDAVVGSSVAGSVAAPPPRGFAGVHRRRPNFPDLDRHQLSDRDRPGDGNRRGDRRCAHDGSVDLSIHAVGRRRTGGLDDPGSRAARPVASA